jgi:uncharacterized protein HemX
MGISKVSYLVILLVIGAGAALVGWLRSRTADGAAALKQRYQQLVLLSGRQADEALRHQLTAARKKYPGRSEQWYLEKIIYDLERDRR